LLAGRETEAILIGSSVDFVFESQMKSFAKKDFITQPKRLGTIYLLNYESYLSKIVSKNNSKHI